MKSVITAAAIVGATATTGLAGGVDRTYQGLGILFEEGGAKGGYIEFSFASVNPKVSGVGGGTIPNPVQPTPGASSGDMAPSYSLFGISFKMPVTPKFDMALIIDEPFGADVNYPAGTGYFAGGSTATLDTVGATVVGRYKFNENISVYGGIRAQSMKADVTIPFAGYMASGKRDVGIGYLVGAAYEIPAIKGRVSLTYNSKVKHELQTSETSILGPMRVTNTEITTPQSVALEFQTGVAKDTLVFGGVRWAEWSKFDISPADYATLTGGSLVAFDDDIFTYDLGVGRRLNENWSVFGRVTYEKSNGGFASNLSPTDGKTSLGLGVTYSKDNMKLTAGVSHTWIGDANTRLSSLTTLPAGVFADNTALAFGLKAGFSF